jgi:hypothetical protein
MQGRPAAVPAGARWRRYLRATRWRWRSGGGAVAARRSREERRRRRGKLREEGRRPAGLGRRGGGGAAVSGGGVAARRRSAAARRSDGAAERRRRPEILADRNDRRSLSSRSRKLLSVDAVGKKKERRRFIYPPFSPGWCLQPGPKTSGGSRAQIQTFSPGWLNEPGLKA